MRGSALVLAAAVICAGCTGSPSRGLLRQFASQNSLTSFLVCHDYGCAKNATVPFSDGEWAQIRTVFTPAPQDAAEERERIRKAVALMETLVGPKAGTSKDAPGAALEIDDRGGQMDCIDEAYNTSNYLLLFNTVGLLHWHVPGMPVRRGSFIDRWPHNTATIVERGSGDTYTVDSWFGANGELPDVVPVQAWLDGWHPAPVIAASN
jgi:hypothetical protein